MQWLALASVLGALALTTAIDARDDFRRERELAFIHLSARASLLETQVEHRLDTLNFALGNLQAAATGSGKGLDSADMDQELERMQASLRGVRTLLVLDADGVARASTRQELVGGNFAHREYFRAVIARPDPDRLYVSPPFRTVLGVLSITVSRALSDRNGRFAGVVSATLDPEYFLQRLESARYAEDMQVALVAGDRSVFLAVPDTASAWWQDAAGGIFGTPAAGRGTDGAALSIAEAHNERRAVAVRWVRTANMAPGSDGIGVLASRSLAVIDADGYRDVAVKAALYAAVVFAAVLGSFLLQRRQRAFDEAQARHEQVLRDSNAELAARTREAEEAGTARTRFLSSVSHELRTPLHTMLGYVRLLLKRTSGEMRGQLAIIERSGAQLMRLIDDLLEFNRQTDLGAELQPEPVALRDIIVPLEQAGDMMAQPRHNRFTVTLGDDLPAAVSVDDRRLLEVLQNLIDNACKYTGDGTVDLRIERGDGAPEDGRCRLRFSVDDTGIGIAPQEQASIFDVFSRGTATGGQPGLGLGLAIARRWVRAMGGDIEVQSEPGRGSRFFFTLDLPAATLDEQAPPPPCEAFRKGLAAAARTVLVVDDVAANRLLLRDLCEHWGFGVLEAGDGAEALATCLTPAAAIDAVLVDQFMPGMDGWEFLRRVRETPALCRLPAVLISASTAQKPAGFPPGIDFDLELGKPLDQQALLCFLCLRMGLVEQPLPACQRPNATTVAAPAPVALPADELAKFRQLLHLGRVVAIAQWAQDLATADPTYGDFADRVARYCQAADLPALESLAQAARQA